MSFVALRCAQINLTYTPIVAPFDGVATSRSVDVGQLVITGSTSATPLFIVTDQSKLRIYVQVPQNYSNLINPGMTASFTVPELPGHIFTAQLVASADAIVSQSGTQLVQFQIVSLRCDAPHTERLTDKAEFFQPQAKRQRDRASFCDPPKGYHFAVEKLDLFEATGCEFHRVPLSVGNSLRCA